MYFIHRGSVAIHSASGDLIAKLGEGAFFGESALINSKPRSATIRAESYCDLYVLHRAALERVMGRFPAFFARRSSAWRRSEAV